MNEQPTDSKDLKTEAAKTLFQAGWLYRDVVKALGFESTFISVTEPVVDACSVLHGLTTLKI